MNVLPPGTLRPVLDDLRLRKMAEDITCAAAEQFATDYGSMLPGRMQRIGDAVHAGDREAALDAALSLKASSALVGAVTMELICANLHHALDGADNPAAEKAFREARLHLPHLAAALDARSPAEILLSA
jgi:HPt (histidine-containing phosphotransfer) domain-containing protein